MNKEEVTQKRKEYKDRIQTEIDKHEDVIISKIDEYLEVRCYEHVNRYYLGGLYESTTRTLLERIPTGFSYLNPLITKKVNAILTTKGFTVNSDDGSSYIELDEDDNEL